MLLCSYIYFLLKKNMTTIKFYRFFAMGLLIGIIAALCYWFNTALSEVSNDDELIGSSQTLLQVQNHSNNTVTVYVTLGTTPGCLQNVLDIPFVTDTVPGQNGLQGTFILNPGDSTISYAPDSLGFNGVISFDYAPSNCPDSLQYPNGINQFEFILNNSYQGIDAQETIDISCVHGVNCVIRTNIYTLNPWNAGPNIQNVQSFANTLDRNQIGTAGVYPYGCDTCTGSKTPPSCIKLPQPAQRSSICNVQRNALQSGGLIKVLYLGKINIADK